MPVAVDEPVGQPVGHRDVVGERVLLVLQPPVQPPAPAALAAAAHVGVRVDHAAVEQAGQRRVPLRVVDGLVGAVPVEQRRRGAVERGVAVPDQRDRHLRAVGRRASVRVSQTYDAGSWPGRLAAGAARCARRCAGRRRTTPAGATYDWSSTVTAAASNSSLRPERDRAAVERRVDHEAVGSRARRAAAPAAGAAVSRPVAEHGVRRRTRPPARAARPGPRAGPAPGRVVLVGVPGHRAPGAAGTRWRRRW